MNNILPMLETLKRTAAIIKYNPTNCPNIAWEFPGTLNPDYIYCNQGDQPEVSDEQVAIFDLYSGVWKVMLKDYVTMDHNKWYKHVKFKEVLIPLAQFLDLLPEEKLYARADGKSVCKVPEMDVYQWCCMSEHECDMCTQFDRQGYDRDIKNYIDTECSKCGCESWDKYFWAAQQDDFKATAKELNLNVIDFFVKCDDQETLEKCKRNWLEIITKTRDDAYIMLEKDLEHELTAHSQDEGWVEADVRAEIEMVKSLLDNVVEETEKMMVNCHDVFQVLRTWPPILLPAPKFINISPMLTKQKILYVFGGSEFEVYDESIL